MFLQGVVPHGEHVLLSMAASHSVIAAMLNRFQVVRFQVVFTELHSKPFMGIKHSALTA